MFCIIGLVGTTVVVCGIKGIIVAEKVDLMGGLMEVINGFVTG